MGFRLGIDTGGTYTDAVLVDDQDGIAAFAKCLTTRYDLSQGIGNALSQLPSDALAQVKLVSLSTTLSTNSVVEGQGAPVAVLLPGYGERQLERSGLLDILGPEQVTLLDGGHDAFGRERQPLDELAAREAILAMDRRASAFAVSSMFGVRNPEHELRLRCLVEELTDKPVTCGHELASGLDAPRRALTVALNARMVPVIRRLILAVREILQDYRVDAPLMMVKGNGSLVSTATALHQPVGTVLSGPAASVVGACALSGERNAIIADMGGTTTDIAVIRNGQPELGEDGVLIGDWKPMVEAVRVISIGLGGDSEVRFSGSSGIEIGPRRVVPLSLLGYMHPEILPRLERQLASTPGRRNNRFALPLEYNDVLMENAGEDEHAAWEQLTGGPLELDRLVQSDRSLARAVARLQRKGMAIYSGFTPSDAAHVLGLSSHWSAEAARLAALIWARQMRHVYGVGRWAENDAETPCRRVYDQVGQQISRALIEAGLHQGRALEPAEAHGLTGLLADMVNEAARPVQSGEGALPPPLFHLDFASDYPVVGVGAPASTFFPDATERLGVSLRLPENAEVANAYGAVMGIIVQRSSVTVTQPLHGRFIVHGEPSPREFDALDKALDCARSRAGEQAEMAARRAGAGTLDIRLEQDDRHVQHDVDGELFLEAVITAIALGRPDLDRLASE